MFALICSFRIQCDARNHYFFIYFSNFQFKKSEIFSTQNKNQGFEKSYNIISFLIAGLFDKQGAEESGVSKGATGGRGASSSRRRKRLQNPHVQWTGSGLAPRLVLGDALSPFPRHGNTGGHDAHHGTPAVLAIVHGTITR